MEQCDSICRGLFAAGLRPDELCLPAAATSRPGRSAGQGRNVLRPNWITSLPRVAEEFASEVNAARANPPAKRTRLAGPPDRGQAAQLPRPAMRPGRDLSRLLVNTGQSCCNELAQGKVFGGPQRGLVSYHVRVAGVSIGCVGSSTARFPSASFRSQLAPRRGRLDKPDLDRQRPKLVLIQ